jgi:8-oxo-dGTP diphosphatase
MPSTEPDQGCREEPKDWDGRPIDTANLRLRALGSADVAAIVALTGGEAVSRTIAELPYPMTEEDAHTFIAAAGEPFVGSGRRTFAVERRAAPGLIGCAGITAQGDIAEITYWIGPQYWGKGYSTEMAHALARLIFRNHDFVQAEVEFMSVNAASERVLVKAGFRYLRDEEGQSGRCAGQSVRIYALSREAWEAREAAKPTLLVVAAALVDVDGRILMTQRPEGKSMAALWEFPGGKVNVGETPEAALVRELGEELGIDITASCLAPLTFASHSYDAFHLLMPLYACRVWGGTISPRESQAMTWVRPARMVDLPMPPADLPLVALIRDLL